MGILSGANQMRSCENQKRAKKKWIGKERSLYLFIFSPFFFIFHLALYFHPLFCGCCSSNQQGITGEGQAANTASMLASCKVFSSSLSIFFFLSLSLCACFWSDSIRPSDTLTVAYQRLSSPSLCIWALHSPIDIHANHPLGFFSVFFVTSPSHDDDPLQLLWTEWAISPISCNHRGESIINIEINRVEKESLYRKPCIQWRDVSCSSFQHLAAGKTKTGWRGIRGENS